MVSISKTRARVRRDRLSELPDSLITHILSFLNTKEAVRTSLLSTRWKKPWTRVPNLEFGHEDYPIGIDRALLFRDSSSNIQKFALCLDLEEPPPYLDFVRIDGWIRTVIWHNVVELHLCVDSEFPKQMMKLPQSLFTSKTLKVLKLRSYFIINPPTSRCFPSLKVLEVWVPVPRNDISMLEKIFSNCPVLEDLTIYACFPLSRACDINISAPELKMLKISLFGEGQYEQENEEMDGYNFFINAPKLVNFDLLMDHLSAYRFQVNANAHFKAKIKLVSNDEEYDSGIAILDTISTVKHLSLSSSFVFEVLPDFVNLTHLELEAPFDISGWAHLIEFLKRSPSLEYLSITRYDWYDCEWPDVFYPQEAVPDCMLTHLKTIRFENFGGRQNEMRVAEYLLKYSQVLKKMIVNMDEDCMYDYDGSGAGAGAGADERAIYRQCLMFERAIYREFLMFKRGSVTCKVELLNMPSVWEC